VVLQKSEVLLIGGSGDGSLQLLVGRFEDAQQLVPERLVTVLNPERADHVDLVKPVTIIVFL